MNVARFTLPPLRERREDIPMLAEFFLQKNAKKMRESFRFGEGALDYLSQYDYPGNIRELENMIEQGAALATNGVLRRDDLVPTDAPRTTTSSNPPAPDGRSLQSVVDSAEKAAIETVLRGRGEPRKGRRHSRTLGDDVVAQNEASQRRWMSASTFQI